MKKYPWIIKIPIKGIDVETGKEIEFEMTWIEWHYIPDPRKRKQSMVDRWHKNLFNNQEEEKGNENSS